MGSADCYSRMVPEPNTGCWLWLMSCSTNGYGQFRGKPVHRLSYELTHGPIPKGLCVMHACDVPTCINPAHLRLGTFADNNRDRARKGRSCRGARHWTRRSALPRGEQSRTSKISDDIRREIRRRALAGENPRLLAAEFGISRPHVSRLKRAEVEPWV